MQLDFFWLNVGCINVTTNPTVRVGCHMTPGWLSQICRCLYMHRKGRFQVFSTFKFWVGVFLP